MRHGLPESHEDLREYYRTKADEFIQDILGLQCRDFHKAWLELRNENEKSLLLAPRGHGKSEVATIAWSVWRLAYDHDLRILIVSASAMNAERFAGKIRADFETNAQLLELFPGLRASKNDKWTNRAFTISGRSQPHEIPTITALGAGSAVTSGHYDIVILDDIIDLDDVTNEDMLRKKLEWYDNVLDPVADHELHLSGTRWHMADIYGELLERNKKVEEFAFRIDKALYSEGDELPFDREFINGFACLWPDGPPRNCSLERLLNLRATNAQAFSLQRQNEPTGGPLAKFRKEWFRYGEWEGKLVQPHYQIFQYVDFSAFGEKATSDFFVVSTIALAGNQLWILDIYRQHQPTFREQAQAIIQQVNKWNPLCCGIEAVQYQKAMYQVLKDVSPRMASIMRAIKVTKDKVIRSVRLSNAYEAGRVIHPPVETHPWVAAMELELIQFPLGAHDDQVDALCGAANIAFDMSREWSKQGVQPVEDIDDLLFGGVEDRVFT